MYHCARLLAIAAIPVISSIWASQAHGQDPTLPMNGLFYGVDGPIDLVGNSVYPYRRPIGYRFEAEIAGQIIGVRWQNRYNRGSETGYSVGNGGTILLEIRKNDPSLEHPPLASGSDHLAPLPDGDPNLLGRTAATSSASSLGLLPILRFTKPIPVTAGQRYWLVFNQLDRRNYVSINSAYIYSGLPTGMQGPGGPYYGDAPHIACAKNGNWLHQHGSPWEDSRHLVKAQFLYRLPDGKEIWSGFGSAHAIGARGLSSNGQHGSRRAFNDAQPIQQRFTPSRPTFSTRKLYLRAYRMQGERTPGSMKILLLRDSSVVRVWSVPASRFPVSKVAPPAKGSPPPYPPIPFVSIDLGAPVTLTRGATYYLQLGTGSGNYYLHAQQTEERSFNNRNTFRDGWAQYSTDRGQSWRGWHLGSKNGRTDLVLPFMFEVLQ
jgi:hypothetical protein